MSHGNGISFFSFPIQTEPLWLCSFSILPMLHHAVCVKTEDSNAVYVVISLLNMYIV
jgi:hypothetical protein